MPLEIAVGAIGAVAVIVGARAVRFERVLVLSLVALPLVYAAFAAVDGDVGKAVLELAVGVPFIVAGLYLFVRPGGPALAVAGAFWIVHAVFDVVRDGWLGNDGVPVWYPAVCLGFDLAVGSYLLMRQRRTAAAAAR